jgi:hypothetical protein
LDDEPLLRVVFALGDRLELEERDDAAEVFLAPTDVFLALADVFFAALRAFVADALREPPVPLLAVRPAVLRLFWLFWL